MKHTSGFDLSFCFVFLSHLWTLSPLFFPLLMTRAVSEQRWVLAPVQFFKITVLQWTEFWGTGGKKQKTKRRIKKKLAWWSFHCLECVFFHKRFFFLLSLPSVPEMRPCLCFPSALRGTGRVSGPLAQPFTSPPCTNSHTSSRSITSSLCLPTTVRGIKGLLQPSGNEIYTHGPLLTSHFHVLSAAHT